MDKKPILNEPRNYRVAHDRLYNRTYVLINNIVDKYNISSYEDFSCPFMEDLAREILYFETKEIEDYIQQLWKERIPKVKRDVVITTFSQEAMDYIDNMIKDEFEKKKFPIIVDLTITRPYKYNLIF